MKIASILVVASGILAGGAVHAQGVQISAEALARAQDRYDRTNYGEQPAPMPVPVVGGKTRAQVRDELHSARAAGLISHGELDYPALAQSPAASTARAQVRQELAQARAAGLVSVGELDYPPTARG